MKIHKGDQVLIIKGKDKGKKSKVLRGFPKKNQLLIEGANIRKVHKRPKKEGEKGQVVEVPFPLDISKLRLICSKCGKPTKVRYEGRGGKKYRMCKRCGAEV